MPSYVNVNLGAEEKSIQIWNLCLDNMKNSCKQVHDWLFTESMIRSVSLYKRDERCLFLYVHQNSDDFQMYFPSVQCRQRFYDLVLEMTRGQEGMVSDLDAYMTDDQIKVIFISILLLNVDVDECWFYCFFMFSVRVRAG